MAALIVAASVNELFQSDGPNAEQEREREGGRESLPGNKAQQFFDVLQLCHENFAFRATNTGIVAPGTAVVMSACSSGSNSSSCSSSGPD